MLYHQLLLSATKVLQKQKENVSSFEMCLTSQLNSRCNWLSIHSSMSSLRCKSFRSYFKVSFPSLCWGVSLSSSLAGVWNITLGWFMPVRCWFVGRQYKENLNRKPPSLWSYFSLLSKNSTLHNILSTHQLFISVLLIFHEIWLSVKHQYLKELYDWQKQTINAAINQNMTFYTKKAISVISIAMFRYTYGQNLWLEDHDVGKLWLEEFSGSAEPHIQTFQSESWKVESIYSTKVQCKLGQCNLWSLIFDWTPSSSGAIGLCVVLIRHFTAGRYT